jgi:hypothetical protein
MRKLIVKTQTVKVLDSADHLKAIAGGGGRPRPRPPTIRHIPDGNGGKEE